MGRWIDIHGMPPIPSGNDSLSHIWFIQKEHADIYDATHAFVEPMDYLIARLTGVVAANACTVFPLLVTDNRDISSIDYDAGLIETAGIDAEKLPPLLPVSGSVGTLRPEVAANLGLSTDTLVYAGMNDTQAVAVGIGTFRPGVGGINVGTTTQILADVAATRTDTVNAILGMPSAIPGRYTAMAENGLGGKLLEHFVLNVIFSRDAFADHSTEDAYAHFEEIVAAEEPGAGGLLFLPWLTGSQSPVMDPNVRGGFLNMSLATTRTQMLRAIIEGVSFNMRWTLPAVETFCGRKFEELHFSGGGAISDEWSQIMADVMARPVLQVEDARYLNSRASAFLGFHQAGLVGLEEIENFCPIKKRYEPNPAHVDLYEGRFEQFLAAFEQNRSIFAKLNAAG
jgi:xylulokinase